MPNWTFLALHFFHTMALALWVGGIVAIGVIVAPVAFAQAPERKLAGAIVGRSLQRFDRIVVLCIVALAITSFLMVLWYGRWSRWYAIEYACIVLMSASALFSMAVLTPRMRRRRENLDAGADDDRDTFHHLHQLATLSMQFNLACGTVAILFS